MIDLLASGFLVHRNCWHEGHAFTGGRRTAYFHPMFDLAIAIGLYSFSQMVRHWRMRPNFGMLIHDALSGQIEKLPGSATTLHLPLVHKG